MEKRYKVSLTYFKSTGKYYTEGEYETTEEWMFKILDEVKQMKADNKLPGINGSDFIIHIDVEDDHPNGYPCLIL